MATKRLDEMFGSETELQHFCDETVQLLELEYESELAEVSGEISRRSLNQLQKEGIALARLHLASVGSGLCGRSLLTLEANNDSKLLPAHRFTTGDIVGLYFHLTETNVPLCEQANMNSVGADSTGVIYRISPSKIVIAVEDIPDNLDQMVSITRFHNEATFRRQMQAIQHLRGLSDGPSLQLREALFNIDNTLPRFSRYLPQIISMDHLNDPQQSAVHLSLRSLDVCLIHGPPGTGKTTTVVEVIRQAVHLGQKVLACAPSNIAVDNLAEKLAQAKNVDGSPIRLCRIGHPARLLPSIIRYSLDAMVETAEGTAIASDIRKEMDTLLRKIHRVRDKTERRGINQELRNLRREAREREGKVVDEIIGNARVILCTCDGASHWALKNAGDFDLVVIDEAAQALEASCWIPLLRGKRCVLAGDHCQLPPTIKSRQAEERGLGITLFHRVLRMFGNCSQPDEFEVCAMLTVQYRMHEQIMKWASDELYNSRLEAHSSVANHLLCDIDGVKSFDPEDDDTRLPLVIVDTTGCDMEELVEEDGASKANPGEADIVVEHVKRLINMGLQPKDIGIISPYNAQVGLIRGILLKSYVDLEISSVDSFQGREKEAIILSLVRSNSSKELGFLTDDRRLNVAITRAKRHVVVVCDAETVSTHDFLRRMVEYFSEIGKYRGAMEYIHTINPNLLGEAENRATASGLIRRSDEKQDAKKKKKRERKTSNKIDHSRNSKFSDKEASQSKIERKVEDHENIQLAKEQFSGLWLQVKTYFESCDSESSVAWTSADNMNRLEFSSSLSAAERRAVHMFAEDLGIQHESIGEKADRKILVWKAETHRNEGIEKGQVETNKESEEIPKLNYLHDSNQEKHSMHSIQDTTEYNTKGFIQLMDESEEDPSVVDPSVVDLSSLSVKESDVQSTNNTFLAQLHMDRLNRSNQEKDKKKKKSRAKNPELEFLNALDKAVEQNSNKEQDKEMQILDQAVSLSRRCAFEGCKKKIELMGAVCFHCNAKFCYTHGQAEVHGCGEAASREAREKFRRNMTQERHIVSGNVIAARAKPLQEHQRNHLRNSLHKKINQSVKSRSAKPSNKSSKKK